MNNIYCIYSTSYRLLDKELNNILNGNSYTTYDANEVDIDDIFENANYISLFLDTNYIVVKNVNWFSSQKKDTKKSENIDDKIINYLNNPNKSTVLILLLSDKMNGVKKISKMIKEKYKYIEILDYNVKELREFVNNFLKKNKIKMDYDSVNYLINNSLNKYDLVMNELDKILLYEKKDLSLKDVMNIVSTNVLDNNYKFIDVVMEKNIKEIFHYYDDFLLNKNSPILILNMIANEYRNIYLIKILMKSRDKSELMNLLNIRYSFQLDKLINYSYSYKEKELEDNLCLLCDLDYMIKQGKISDKIALEWFFIKSCR